MSEQNTGSVARGGLGWRRSKRRMLILATATAGGRDNRVSLVLLEGEGREVIDAVAVPPSWVNTLAYEASGFLGVRVDALDIAYGHMDGRPWLNDGVYPGEWLSFMMRHDRTVQPDVVLDMLFAIDMATKAALVGHQWSGQIPPSLTDGMYWSGPIPYLPWSDEELAERGYRKHACAMCGASSGGHVDGCPVGALGKGGQ